ncbi:MAG: GNAT family N-acetyltransferase, partial [Candidatus Rokubacteria bacterium]|nr:GNAT family N-acetyltransferase [Candidatus Rokubacteria bacterium]
MTEPRIEPARGEDLPAIERLLTACNLPLEGVREHVTGFLVARAGGRVVGCAGMEVYGRSCVLRSLAVLPEARRRGLGGRLLVRLQQRARESGCTDAYLLTNTVEAMAAGHRFARIAREDVPAGARQSGEFALSACASAAVMHRSLR